MSKINKKKDLAPKEKLEAAQKLIEFLDSIVPDNEQPIILAIALRIICNYPLVIENQGTL